MRDWVEHRAKLRAVMGGGVGDLEPPDKAVLAVDADMVLVAEHRQCDLRRGRPGRSFQPPVTLIYFSRISVGKAISPILVADPAAGSLGAFAAHAAPTLYADMPMNEYHVAVDIEREIVTLSLCHEKAGYLQAIIQRMIAHYAEPWIDDTMLNASKADLQSLNRIIRHAIGARKNVRIELSYPQTSDLMFALMYATNRLADDPRVSEDVRGCIEAVAADLICRIGRVQDQIRRRAHSR